jgi:hypothetical protein
MKTDKHTVKACCGNLSTLLKIDRVIDESLLNYIISLGYEENKSFTRAGIVYLTSTDIIITGTIGSNKLNLKCKNNKCEAAVQSLEELLSKF